MLRLLAGILILSLGIIAIASADKGKPTTRGHQWVRSHPFTINAIIESPVNIEQYKQMGFTSIIAVVDPANKEYTDHIFGSSQKLGLGWHWFYRWTPGHDREAIDGMRLLRSRYKGCLGFSIGDENPESELSELGKMLSQARQAAPDELVYCAMRGKDMVPEYTHKPELYLEYVDRVVAEVKPDVLMYDQYPFYRGGTAGTFYQNLAIIREKALAAGVPYWNWLQGFAWKEGPFHEPSESELRLQAFASLTYGFTGLSYWTYASHYDPYSKSLLDPAGKPTTIGETIASMTPELRILGEVLKDVKSTGVYYCASRMYQDGQWLYPQPPGTVRWTEQTDSRMKSVAVSNGPHGFLMGLFKDDEGREYMMLTNTNHGKNKSSQDTLGVITLRFDWRVSVLERLDRRTGSWVPVYLADHTLLHQVLPGGTGDLFRFVK
jgi:hypothetical protein